MTYKAQHNAAHTAERLKITMSTMYVSIHVYKTVIDWCNRISLGDTQLVISLCKHKTDFIEVNKFSRDIVCKQ